MRTRQAITDVGMLGERLIAAEERISALERGDTLSPERRKETIAKLHTLTGLSETFLEDTNLRINDGHWYKELLRKDRFTMGRYDSRFVGIDRVSCPARDLANRGQQSSRRHTLVGKTRDNRETFPRVHASRSNQVPLPKGIVLGPSR